MELERIKCFGLTLLERYILLEAGEKGILVFLVVLTRVISVVLMGAGGEERKHYLFLAQMP